MARERYGHVCEFVDGGVFGGISFMVMTLLWKDVHKLRKETPMGKFSLNTTVRIAVQTLDALECLHKIGFIHRDIKPQNLVAGDKTNSRMIYLVDFGLIKPYMFPDGMVRPEKKKAGTFFGTTMYASPNAHRGSDLGRRDDLFSWFYTMIELANGKLPWSRSRNEDYVSIF